MKGVELYGEVRRAVYVEGLSRREAARRFGIDPRTVAKMLAFSVPPGYRRNGPPARPKLDGFVGLIDQILEEDKARPAKQQHTSKRIFERLRDEHGYGRRDHDSKGLRVPAAAAVTRDVRAVAPRSWARAGRLRRGGGGGRRSGTEDPLLRDGFTAQRRLHGAGLPDGEQRGFLRGHRVGFEFFGGVPRSILYDNTRLAVARILGDGRRLRTRVFSELQSHYLFADRFGRPGKGNDKGKVEGLVGYARRNFMVPVPHATSFADLNARLLECCRRRLNDRLRSHDETVGARLGRDRSAFLPPPAVPYEACEKCAARVSSLSLVRYRRNDYSVPTADGHREVLVRGYVHEVVIACGAEAIARHPRSYEREDFIFDPLHYLALLERKINALDQAAPLVGWSLPEEFATLRRLLEARLGKPGKREFVQVLRLMEVFRTDDVAAAVREAIARGVIGFDAVKHLVLCRIERRPPRLDLRIYPYLPPATVATTSARSYLSLLAQGTAS